MKAKICCDSDLYTKQKDIAINIAEKFNGLISLNVTPYIDDRIRKNKELYIDSIKIILPHQVTLFLSQTDNNSIIGEFDYGQMLDNDKAHSVVYKLRAFLHNNRIDLRN